MATQPVSFFKEPQTICLIMFNSRVFLDFDFNYMRLLHNKIKNYPDMKSWETFIPEFQAEMCMSRCSFSKYF